MFYNFFFNDPATCSSGRKRLTLARQTPQLITLQADFFVYIWLTFDVELRVFLPNFSFFVLLLLLSCLHWSRPRRLRVRKVRNSVIIVSRSLVFPLSFSWTVSNAGRIIVMFLTYSSSAVHIIITRWVDDIYVYARNINGWIIHDAALSCYYSACFNGFHK